MKTCALLIGCSLSFAAVADESAIVLKADPQRDLVVGNCVMCHSLDYIPMNSPFLDSKGWEATVAKMVNVMGAPIKPDDAARIVEYLGKHYGKP
jgi:hypothetical protein